MFRHRVAVSALSPISYVSLVFPAAEMETDFALPTDVMIRCVEDSVRSNAFSEMVAARARPVHSLESSVRGPRSFPKKPHWRNAARPRAAFTISRELPQSGFDR
jgi:hypothetical protein